MLKLTTLLLVLHALFVLSQAELSDSQKALLVSHHKLCMESLGLPPAKLEQIKNGQFPDDPQLKEHIYCVSKKIGFQNDAGDIQPEVVAIKVGAQLGSVDKARELSKKCLVTEATPKDTAYQMFKCMYPDARSI